MELEERKRRKLEIELEIAGKESKLNLLKIESFKKSLEFLLLAQKECGFQIDTRYTNKSQFYDNGKGVEEEFLLRLEGEDKYYLFEQYSMIKESIVQAEYYIGYFEEQVKQCDMKYQDLYNKLLTYDTI